MDTTLKSRSKVWEAAFGAIALVVAGTAFPSWAPAQDEMQRARVKARLAPGDSDALAAKGFMLLRLPSILGGDSQRGEQLLREALIRNPENAAARDYVCTNIHKADVRGVEP
jgi:hypothetical protein